MDGGSRVIDSREEVKKLQNLVRQLELQNAQLRSRQRNRSSPAKTVNCRKLSNSSDSAKTSLDDVDIIDLEELDLSDEEDSWLFQSPKKLTEEQKSISPYKWMRRDVEDPENVDLQTTKQALVNKLDDIARVRFSSLSHLHLPVRKNPFESEGVSPQLKASLGFNRNIDTRTFTRPKKKRDSERDFKLNDLTAKTTPIAELTSHGPAGAAAEPPDTPEDDCMSTASDSSFSLSSLHRLADVVDVQALARMQEESLRESSPISSPRRGSASSSQHSTTSPILCCESGISHSNPDSLDELPPHSPSDTPFASQCLVDKSKTGNTGNFRRSLPNLNKSHNNMLRTQGGVANQLRQHFSESRLPHTVANQVSPSHSSHEENSDKEIRETTRETTPTRAIDARRLRKDSLPISLSTPQVRSSSPGPRSGIPQFRRSGSPADTGTPRSHLPKPVQSRIPATRMRNKLQLTTTQSPSVNSDDSWKDGCF